MKWTDQSPDNSAVTADKPIVLSATRTLCNRGATGHPVIVTSAPVHEKVLTHLRRSSDEQGGLLIGVPYRQPGNTGPAENIDIVSVVCAVPATQSSGTGYSLRMEAAVWADANEKMSSLALNGKRIIGWYHSHPGLGAFFSSTDMRTQRAFFSHFYSVGWVIDPSDDTHAMFIGPDSQPVSGEIVADPLEAIGQ